MTVDSILEQAEVEQVRELADTAFSRAERAQVIKAVAEYTEAAEEYKKAEAVKKSASERLTKLLQDKGEERFIIPDVAKVTLVTTQGRESLDRPRLVKALLEAGLDKGKIDVVFKKATKVSAGSTYTKITPVKDEDVE